MIDERFATRVASWLHRSDRPARRPNDNVARALEQIHHTRQHRRRLWFLPGPKPTAGADGRQGSVEPAARIETVAIGGTATMFTPTKLFTGAAIAALMGALLLARPFMSQDVNDPASPAGPSDEPIVTLVSGEASGYFSVDSGGKTESANWGYTVTDALGTWELDMSDERLSGRSRMRTDYYARSGSEYGPFAFSMYVENDGGSWDGSGVAWLDPAATQGEPSGAHSHVVLRGQDGYEGMTAILAMDTPDGSSDWAVSGVVQPFELPPTPEAAPTTFE